MAKDTGSVLISDKNYKQLAVYSMDGLMVSTGEVSDGVLPYETGVSHPEYNNGHVIVVEAYLVKEEALEGHTEWVDKMLNCKPDFLEDVCNAHISRFAKELGATTRWDRIPMFDELKGELNDNNIDTTVPKD